MTETRTLDLDLDVLPEVDAPEGLTAEQRGILKGKIAASRAIIADLEAVDMEAVYMLLNASKLSLASLCEAIINIFEEKAKRYRIQLALSEELLKRGEI